MDTFHAVVFTSNIYALKRNFTLSEKIFKVNTPDYVVFFGGDTR